MDFTLVSSVFETLQITPPSKLVLLEAGRWPMRMSRRYPPDMAVFFTGIDSKAIALHLETVLLTTYPKDFNVYRVEVRSLKCDPAGCCRCAGSIHRDLLVYPATGRGDVLESFAEIVAHLRAPDGCPWDKEQTHESLRKHLLEESYEAITAIDSGDFADMREEFGDLLLQIVLNAQIANEEGQFNVNQVVQGIHSKIVRRHPHVFGDVELDEVKGVLANWEKLKEKERSDKKVEKGLSGRSSQCPAGPEPGAGVPGPCRPRWFRLAGDRGRAGQGPGGDRRDQECRD